MSTINVNSIDKESGSTLTLGGSGTTVAVHASATTSGFDSGLASVQTFTSSGTWTRPTGITKVIMEVQGAGGSGARRDSAPTLQAVGGAAGGYAKKLLDVSSISTATITVGTGGATPTSQGTGNSGGTSSWADGTNTISCTGGAGGIGDSNGIPNTGGTATGGDININGRCGFPSPLYYTISGADSMFGEGGCWRYSTQSFDGPTGYGAGGGFNHSTNSTNNNGANGIVIVWEYK